MIKIFHKAKSLMVGIHMSKTVLEAKSLLVRNYMRRPSMKPGTSWSASP